MKTIALLMVLSAGAALAGSGVVTQTSSVTMVSYGYVPRIPQPIMQGIKDLAVQVHPTHPKNQMDAVTAGVNAYLALQAIPDNPGKRAAAEDFPFDFPKQLFLAQRPLQN